MRSISFDTFQKAANATNRQYGNASDSLKQEPSLTTGRAISFDSFKNALSRDVSDKQTKVKNYLSEIEKSNNWLPENEINRLVQLTKVKAANDTDNKLVYDNILKSLESRKEVYGNFKTADEFNAAKKDADLRDKYKGYTYDEIQRLIGSQERRGAADEETEWLKKYGTSVGYGDAESYDKELAKLEKEIDEAYIKGKKTQYGDNGYAYTYYSNQREIDELKNKRTQLQRDKAQLVSNQKLAEYKTELPKAEDFSIKSKFDFSVKQSGDNGRYYAVNGQFGGYETDNALITYMEPDEKQIYTYLFNKKGVKAADHFFEDMRPVLNQRQSVEQTENTKAFIDKNGFNAVLGNIGTFGSQLIDVVQAPKKLIGSLTGDYEKNWAAYDGLTTFTNTVRTDTAQDLNAFFDKNKEDDKQSNTAGFIYNTLMSIGDMLTALAVGGGAAKAIGAVSGAANTSNIAKGITQFVMSSEAASQTMTSARERGLSGWQVAALGVASGAIEAATEKLPLDNLFSQGAKGLKSVGKQIVTEGAEEAISNVLNTLADDVIAGNESEMKTQIRDLMANGTSYKDAVQQVVLGKVKEIGLDALGGALSGGIMGGGSVALSRLANVYYSVPKKQTANITDTQKWAEDAFSKINNTTDVKGLGKVSVDADSMSDAITKTKNANQAVAFPALNSVLKKGTVTVLPGESLARVDTVAMLNGEAHTVTVAVQKESVDNWKVVGMDVDGEAVYDAGGYIKAQAPVAESAVDTETAEIVAEEVAQEQTAEETAERESNILSLEQTELDRYFIDADEQTRADFTKRFEQATGTRVVFDETMKEGGKYRNGVITINPNTDTPMTVLAHELSHHLELDPTYADFFEYVLESKAFNSWVESQGNDYKELRNKIIASRQGTKYALGKSGDAGYEAGQELLGYFLGQKVFRDTNTLAELERAKPKFFERVRELIANMIQYFKSTPMERELRKIEKMLKSTVQSRKSTNAESESEKYSVLPKNKSKSETKQKEENYTEEEAEKVAESLSTQKLREILKKRTGEKGILDIARMTEEDADTTPTIEKSGVKNKKGDGKSAFYGSLQGADIFSDELKTLSATNSTIMQYDRIGNKETMAEANEEINRQGRQYIEDFLNKSSENFTVKDVAAGFILMGRYNAVGDARGAVMIAEKLRDVGTKSGQTVQIFSIISRLTPDGMQLYAQRELSKAFENMVKEQSIEWGRKHKSEFNLTDEDIEYIRRKAVQASQLPDGRDKYIRLGEIAARIQSKIPPSKGAGFKAWQRTAMLLNPKTQARNFLGNALVIPQYIASDFVGTAIDKAFSKKTGVRTTSASFSAKTISENIKAAKQGFFNSWDDFCRHINTREFEQGRFDVKGESLNNFSNKNLFTRSLNALDRFNSFLLEAGDRPFYQMWFINSLNAQMRANKVTEPTADMVDIAVEEALQRTWQDTNNYTKMVSGIKNNLNRFQVGGYGAGDLFIKFVKTPANLTKAVVDFSPLGFLNLLSADSRRFVEAVKYGEATPQMQKAYVKNLSNAITGTIMTVIYAIVASLGWTTGKKDEDKDVSDFERYVQGYQPYSFKVGKSSFSYDWAQPTATTLAIVTDFIENKREAEVAGEKLTAFQNITEALKAGGNVLFEQSFMESLKTLFSDDGLTSGIVETLLQDPLTLVPQVLSQTAATFDPNIRNTYEYGNSPKTVLNKALNKIPIARNFLAESVDVLGNEKMQAAESVWGRILTNFFSPANVQKGYDSAVADEVYRLYQVTGQSSAIPPKAPNYVETENGKITFDSKQVSEYQKVMGKISSEAVESLLKSSVYTSMDNEKQVELLKKIYSYSNQVARQKVASVEMSEEFAKVEEYIQKGIPAYEYFLLKKVASTDDNNYVSQEEAYAALDSSGLTQSQKEIMLGAFGNWKSNKYKRSYY